MKNYQVWIVARDAATLDELARAVIYENDDRLVCEGFNESMTAASKALAALFHFGEAVHVRKPAYMTLTLPSFSREIDAVIEQRRSLARLQEAARDCGVILEPVRMARGPRIKGVISYPDDQPPASGDPATVRVTLGAKGEIVVSQLCDCIEPDPRIAGRCPQCGKARR